MDLSQILNDISLLEKSDPVAATEVTKKESNDAAICASNSGIVNSHATSSATTSPSATNCNTVTISDTDDSNENHTDTKPQLQQQAYNEHVAFEAHNPHATHHMYAVNDTTNFLPPVHTDVYDVQQHSQQQNDETTQHPNSNDILDLDAQKIINSHPHEPLNDTMQNASSFTMPDGNLINFIQQPQQRKDERQYQSVADIKQEFVAIKCECNDTQYYVDEISTFDANMCQQQQQVQLSQKQMWQHYNNQTLSSSEFPLTTTGTLERQAVQQNHTFGPPTTSSAPSSYVTTIAEFQKYYESRRPKTVYCSACKKWFTSTGHLKRHYSTLLHKKGVKSSGLPDPANLPRSMQHQPNPNPPRASSVVIAKNGQPPNKPQFSGMYYSRVFKGYAQQPFMQQAHANDTKDITLEKSGNNQTGPAASFVPTTTPSSSTKSLLNKVQTTISQVSTNLEKQQQLREYGNSICHTINHPTQYKPFQLNNYMLQPVTMEQAYYTQAAQNSYAPISVQSQMSSPQAGDLPPPYPIMYVPNSTMHGKYSPSEGYYSPVSKTPDLVVEKENAKQKPAVKRPRTESDEINNTKRRCMEPSLPESKPNLSKSRSANCEEPCTSQQAALAATSSTVRKSHTVQCDECDKTFTKNCYLIQHKKSCHFDKSNFRCLKCGKRFAEEHVRDEHSARHDAASKVHKCEQCPKRFHHKPDLVRHVMGSHYDLKKNACHICSKRFTRGDHLRKHIESHSRKRKRRASKKNSNTSVTVQSIVDKAVQSVKQEKDETLRSANEEDLLLDDDNSILESEEV